MKLVVELHSLLCRPLASRHERHRIRRRYIAPTRRAQCRDAADWFVRLERFTEPGLRARQLNGVKSPLRRRGITIGQTQIDHHAQRGKLFTAL